MPRHVWSVLSRSHSLDKETNQLSLFEVLEALRFERPPNQSEAERIIVPIPCVVSSLFLRQAESRPEAAEQRIQLRAPDGKLQDDVDARVELDLESSPRTRTFIRLDGLPFTVPGEYLFEVSVRGDDPEDWKLVARVPVNLTETGRSQH